MGVRGYYRFPWSPAALEQARELAGLASYRRIARELRERRLTRDLVDPATVRRALLRLQGGQR